MHSESYLLELESRGIERTATKLFHSGQGVEYRAIRLLRHLRVPNSRALIVKAYRMGILTTAPWPPEAAIGRASGGREQVQLR